MLFVGEQLCLNNVNDAMKTFLSKFEILYPQNRFNEDIFCQLCRKLKKGLKLELLIKMLRGLTILAFKTVKSIFSTP